MKAKKVSLRLVAVLLVPCLWRTAGGAAQASDVQARKTATGWQLSVDGNPFFVKGVGCNLALGKNGEDYLRMAKEMGANAVRTWGETPISYLDRAGQLDLKVAVGFWLNAVRSQTPESYRDASRCRRLKGQILSGIHGMKDHPAVLFWVVGTEVFSHTEDPQEKLAFGAFLTDLIEAIHKEDPRHPVAYGTSDEGDLPDLMARVPNVDIIGIDTYGALGQAMGWIERHHWDKPTAVIEFGPHGAWDVPKDRNGAPFDPSDALKASDYESTWRQIDGARDRCLGGFAFVLGEPRNQDSVTWFNINDGPLRRKAYWSLYRLYTANNSPHPIPQISEFTIEPSTGIRAGDRFTVQATATAPDGRPLEYRFSIAKIFSDALIVDQPRYVEAHSKEVAPGTAILTAPGQPDLYRVYARVSDADGNVAVADRSLKVLGPSAH